MMISIPNVEYYATIELKDIFNGVREGYNCLNINIKIKGIYDDIINGLIQHIEDVGFDDNDIEMSIHSNYKPKKKVTKKLKLYNAQEHFELSMYIHNNYGTNSIKISLIPINKSNPKYKGDLYEFCLYNIEKIVVEDIKKFLSKKKVKANLTICTDTLTNSNIKMNSDYLILTLCNLRIIIQ